MPTEPHETILNRDILKEPSLQGTPLDEASAAIREAVSYATSALNRCQESPRGQEEESLPVLACFFRIIQMTDAVEVLLSRGCGPPASLLVRSSFEAKLAMEYILERDSSRRAFAWLAFHVLRRIKELEKLGRDEFSEILSADGLDGIAASEVPEIRIAIDQLRSVLKRPGYRQAHRAYERMRIARKDGRLEWYSLYDGPTTARGLAKGLRQATTYETLYRSASAVGHGQDICHLLFPVKGEPSVFAHTRDPLKILPVATAALPFIVTATHLILKEFRPDEVELQR